MNELAIFLVGLGVTVVTLIAVVLVGLSEAADPVLSQPEDLTEWERSIVADKRGMGAASRDAGSAER